MYLFGLTSQVRYITDIAGLYIQMYLNCIYCQIWYDTDCYPTNTSRWNNVGSMLVHRLRRWTNIKSAYVQRLVWWIVGFFSRYMWRVFTADSHLYQTDWLRRWGPVFVWSSCNTSLLIARDMPHYTYHIAEKIQYLSAFVTPLVEPWTRRLPSHSN